MSRQARALWAAAALGLAGAGCRSAPKDVSAAGFTFTVPGNWASEESGGQGYRHVSFDAFDFDGNCQVQVFSVAVEPGDFVDEMATTFKAGTRTPASFANGLGRFEGATFEGSIPSETAMGKVAQLAGKPSLEVYALRREEQTLGLIIMTLGKPAEKRAARAACAAAFASMRPAVAAK